MLYFEIYFEKNSEDIFWDGKNFWEYTGIKTFKDIRIRMSWLFMVPSYLCFIPGFNVLCMLGYVIKWLLKKTKAINWFDNINV
jgi:hypothetical protein